MLSVVDSELTTAVAFSCVLLKRLRVAGSGLGGT